MPVLGTFAGPFGSRVENMLIPPRSVHERLRDGRLFNFAPEVLLLRGRAAVTEVEVDGVVPEYAQTAARVGGARWKQARRASALRGLRRRASPRWSWVAVKCEGWGFNATDKLVPKQRRQQDYRPLPERAERISDGD